MPLTLDDLIKLYRNELCSPTLVELPENFLSETGALLKKLDTELHSSEGLQREITAEALKETLSLLKRICRIRMMKAVIAVPSEVPQEAAGKEREYYLEIQKILNQVRNEFLKPAGEAPKETAVEEQVPRTMVVMMVEVSEKLVGVDGKVYGPLKTGDVVNLPIPNAEILVKHGIARRLQVNHQP